MTLRGVLCRLLKGKSVSGAADPWANYAGTGRQPGDAGCAVSGNVPPGFCTQLGPGSGSGLLGLIGTGPDIFTG